MLIMNIIYLYSEIMPYQTIVYEELVKYGYSVIAFFDGANRQTPFRPKEGANISYYDSSNYSREQLLDFVYKSNPLILVVCGWANKKYNYIAKTIRSKLGIPVVSPIDSQYLGRLKQKIGFIISPIYIKPLFSHIWVPGVRQYHFARCLGYSCNDIIMNSLSGNTMLFSSAQIEHKRFNYPKNILYVGRYNKVKGLSLLLKAWEDIEDKKGWTLTLVGNGPLKDELEKYGAIRVLDFQSQDNLVKLAEQSGAFILPSIYEPWALVLHEFAASGLPILCSKACGAQPHFVIDGYNGFTFKSNSADAIKNSIETFIELPESELVAMSKRSRELSNYVTPEKSAASLLSILKND